MSIYAEMEASSVEIKKIRRDLDTLLLLYKQLAEEMVPLEEPTAAEKKALKTKDKIYGWER